MPDECNPTKPQQDFIVPYTFRRDDRIVIDGVEYVFENRTREGQTFRRYVDGLAEVFTHAEVRDLVDAGRMVIQPAWYHPGRAEVRQRVGGKTFDQLTRKKRQTALFRKEICDRFIEREQEDLWVSRSDQKMRLVIREIMHERDAANRDREGWGRCGRQIGVQEKAPDPSTLRDWLRRYEWADFDIMALVDNYRRPSGGSRLSQEAFEIHARFAREYASSKKPSKAATYRRLDAYISHLNKQRGSDDQIEKLCERAFERFIDRMDPMYVHAGREGQDAARKKWRPPFGGMDVERPFEHLEMDEWYEDIQTLLTKWEVWQELPQDVRAKIPRERIWLSAAIDVATRVIPAMRFTTGQPTEGSAVSTLEMIVMPNLDVQEAAGAATPFAYGTPERIATDCGSSYISEGFQYRVLEIGADTVLPPAGCPEMRGHIERVFLTIKQRIIQHLAGRTFANVLEKGDQDPQAQAALVATELNKLLVRGVLDEYHNTPHKELGYETPYNCFRRLSAIYGVTPPPPDDIRGKIFGVPLKRRIAQEGIMVAGVRYQSADVQKLRREVGQRNVQVRLDRFNMGQIYVWYPSSGLWIDVPARCGHLDGVSLWLWSYVVQDLKRRNHDVSKLSADVVRQAIRDRDERARQAEQEAGLDLGPLTEEAFERMETKWFRGVGIRDDAADDGEGLGFGPAVDDDEADGDEETDDGGHDAVSANGPTYRETPPDGAARLPAPDDPEPDDAEDGHTHDGLLDRPDAGDEDDDDDLFGNPDEWTSK